MSLVHLHLLLNHVPVIGTFFILFVLGVAVWRRNSEMAKVALILVVGVAIVASIVFLTGEPAEDALENVAGVSDAIIHRHEEAAEAALILSGVGGVLALGLLVWFWRRELPRWAGALTLVGVAAIAGVMGWTANLGGQIRHTEISSFVSPLRGDHPDDR